MFDYYYIYLLSGSHIIFDIVLVDSWRIKLDPAYTQSVFRARERKCTPTRQIPATVEEFQDFDGFCYTLADDNDARVPERMESAFEGRG